MNTFSPTSSNSSVGSNSSYPSPDKDELKRILHEKDLQLQEFNQLLEKSRSVIYSFRNTERDKSTNNSFVSPIPAKKTVIQSPALEDSFSDLDLPISQATSAIVSPALSRSGNIRDVHMQYEKQILEIEKNHEEQTTSLQQEIHKVNLQYAMVTSELADKNEEIRSLKRKIDQLLLEISQKDDFIVLVKENQVNEATDQAKLIQEIQDRNVQIANQANLISKHEETSRRLQEKINFREEDIKSLKEEIGKLRKGDDSQLSEFYRNSQSVQFQQRELEYEKQISQLQTQIAALKQDNEYLMDSVKESENDIKQKYFEDLTAIRKDTIKQVEENSALREEIRELRETQARIMNDLANANSQNEQHSTKYYKLERNLNEMNELHTSAQRELRKAEQRLERLSVENSTLQKQKTELEITSIQKHIYEDLKRDYLLSIEKIQKNFKSLLESLQTDSTFANKEVSQIKLQFMREISDLQNLFLEELSTMKEHLGFTTFENIASDEKLLLSKRSEELQQKLDEFKIENIQLKEKLNQSKASENSTILVNDITKLISSHDSIQQLRNEIAHVYEMASKEGTFSEIRRRVQQKHNEKVIHLTDTLLDAISNQAEVIKEFDLNMCKKLISSFSRIITEKVLPYATSILAELSSLQLIDDKTLIKTEFQKYDKIEICMRKIETWYSELTCALESEFRKLVSFTMKASQNDDIQVHTLNSNPSFVEIKTLVDMLDKEIRQISEIDKQQALSFVKQFKYLHSKEIALRSDIGNLINEKMEVDSILERERIVQRELDITNLFFNHLVLLIEKMSKGEGGALSKTSAVKLEKYKSKRNEFDKILLQKIYKRIYTLKVVLNKDDETIFKNASVLSESNGEEKKLSVQIGEAFNQLKAITKTIVKKYNLLYEQNRKIQEEILSLNSNKNFLKTDRKEAVSIPNQSTPKIHEDTVSDLCILLMVEPTQLIETVRKISKQAELCSKLIQFANSINQLISNKTKIDTPTKLGNVMIGYSDVVSLDYVIQKVQESVMDGLLCEYLKNFYASVKKEISKFSSKQDEHDTLNNDSSIVTRVILALKIQVQTLSTILQNTQLNVEPLPIANTSKEIAEYVKGLLGMENFEAIKTKLNQMYFNVHDSTEKQQEQERMYLKYLELTSKLKTILNVDSIQQIISETRRVVMQLSKYVEQFPKFQKMLQQICIILQVQKVGEIMPAVQRLMKSQQQLTAVNHFFHPKGSNEFTLHNDQSSIDKLSIDELVDLIM